MTDDLKRSLAAKRRQAAGRRFEQRLDAIHTSYEDRHLGKIVPHYPRTVPTPRGRVFAKGGAPVDYSGVLKIEWPGKRLGDPETGVAILQPRAIAFDAKVLDDEHASYTHPLAQRHQIIQLIGFHRGGALAFLLFEDRLAGQLVVVHGLSTFEALLVGEAVKIRGDDRWPRTALPRINPTFSSTDYDYRPALAGLWPEY